nr:hypothetical protein K-LCC10_0279 [Kaumoebavirus]
MISAAEAHFRSENAKIGIIYLFTIALSFCNVLVFEPTIPHLILQVLGFIIPIYINYRLHAVREAYYAGYMAGWDDRK